VLNGFDSVMRIFQNPRISSQFSTMETAILGNDFTMALDRAVGANTVLDYLLSSLDSLVRNEGLHTL